MRIAEMITKTTVAQFSHPRGSHRCRFFRTEPAGENLFRFLRDQA